MKRTYAILLAVALAALGVALAIYSEADDAPGGVILGFLLVIYAIWLGVKAARRTK